MSRKPRKAGIAFLARRELPQSGKVRKIGATDRGQGESGRTTPHGQSIEEPILQCRFRGTVELSHCRESIMRYPPFLALLNNVPFSLDARAYGADQVVSERR